MWASIIAPALGGTGLVIGIVLMIINDHARIAGTTDAADTALAGLVGASA